MSVTETSSSSPALPPDEDIVAADSGSVREAIRAYFERVRGGDVGSFPAVLGLVVLVTAFSLLDPEHFLNAFNFANLITQSAAVIVIAMGLVFVLLIGEIDLSAGYAAGTCGAIICLVSTRWGMPWPLALLGGLLTGLLIGLIIGLLVARLGIPSFVVTLALFISLQGVMLLLIGEGGTIPLRDETLLAVMNKNLTPWMGWLLFALSVGLYGFVSYRGMVSRRRMGLTAESFRVWLVKLISLAVLLGIPTFVLNQERSKHPEIVSLRGVPIVVPLIGILLIVLTFILGRTSFGRHVYAVGGNAEAARRAGIPVPRIRMACFLFCSSMAAVAGLLFASRTNSISPSTGGSTTLLFAVAAAVIGGTSLFGGRGKVRDAIIGGLVIAVITNGMLLLNQPSGRIFFVTGLVLLVAASVDAISRRRAMATGRV